MGKFEKVKEVYRAVKQYEKDWVRYGVNRVKLYYDDVTGNWLEEWEVENTNEDET